MKHDAEIVLLILAASCSCHNISKDTNLNNSEATIKIYMKTEDVDKAWHNSYIPDTTFKMPTANLKGYHGKLLWYYPNGAKWCSIEYLDGFRHGDKIIWHQNGNKWSECRYDYSMLFPDITEWYENGSIACVIRFQSDMKTGDGRWWDMAGNLIASGIYVGGGYWDGTFRVYKPLNEGITDKGIKYKWHTLTFKEGVIVKTKIHD